jgi:hypothetical protein
VGPSSSASDSDALKTQEVLRIYERYAREVVERFDFCPWAARARREGSAQPRVLFQQDLADFSASLRVIDELSEAPRVQVGLLIFPCSGASRLDFEHFVRRLRHADAQRHDPSSIPFAMAAFHPHAAPDLEDPDRLVPFIRRSPDPTIQLVRHDALQQVRGDATGGTALVEVWMLSPAGISTPEEPDIRDRIARNNLRTVRDVGVTAVEAVLADIAADRAESYARVGLTGA